MNQRVTWRWLIGHLVAALALVVTLSAPARPAAAVSPAADPPTLAVRIDSISPAVVTDTTKTTTVTITGQVTNNGSDTAQDVPIAVVPGTVLNDRAQVPTWANGREPQSGTPTVSAQLSTSLAAGDSESFTLSFDSTQLPQVSNFGAVGLSVQTSTDAEHTFLGMQRTKQYEPLTVVWGQPITLPALPELTSLDRDSDRSDTWASLLGDDKASRSLLASLNGLGSLIVPVVDGSLLDKSAGPTPDERKARTSYAQKLAEQFTNSGALVLPGGDPDLAALTPTALPGLAPAAAPAPAPSVPAVRAESDATGALVTALNSGSQPVLSGIAWLTDTSLPTERVTALNELLGNSPTMLVPQEAVPGMPTLARHLESGTTILENDTSLAAAATDLSESEVALAKQRVIAESALIVREYPGVARTLLALPARGSSTSGSTYSELVNSLTGIPWLKTGRMTDITRAIDADRTAAPVTLTSQESVVDPTNPITPERVDQVNNATSNAQNFAAIRTDGSTFTHSFNEAASATLSNRWLGQTQSSTVALNNLIASSAPGDQALGITSSDVNFFAETGRLQVTISNNLPVDLENLTVRLTPGSPGLRVDAQPEAVTIAANSKQTITAPTTALAAGTVPVRVTITTPQGAPIADPADLTVRAQPTGSWIYPALAACVALLIGAGAWRSRARRRNRAAASPSDTTPHEDA